MQRCPFQGNAGEQTTRTFPGLTYTLAYDYVDAPHVLAWKLTQGDITTKLDGSYVFDPGEGGGTDVSYRLEAELRVPIPGFIKMRPRAASWRRPCES